jgi:uncharacterized membrane protein HdeD (DUF308 family)
MLRASRWGAIEKGDIMTDVSGTAAGQALAGANIRWGWLLALGILMLALGVIGLGMSYWLTIVAIFWFGILAIIGGGVQLFDAFHHKGWKGIVWHVIIGIVYIVAGIVMITMPVAAAFWLTIFIAAALVVSGVMRIFMAFRIRDQGSVWWWVLLTGIISIVLGIMVYGTITPPGADQLATAEGQIAWMRSWGWVIGLFVAVELMVEGLALIAVALAAKSAAPSAGSGAATGTGSGPAPATTG